MNYSTDISYAWEVPQKIKDIDEDHEVISHISDWKHKECEVEIRYWDREDPKDLVFVKKYVIGESAPHAICLAALKVVGARWWLIDL